MGDQPPEQGPDEAPKSGRRRRKERTAQQLQDRVEMERALHQVERLCIPERVVMARKVDLSKWEQKALASFVHDPP